MSSGITESQNKGLFELLAEITKPSIVSFIEAIRFEGESKEKNQKLQNLKQELVRTLPTDIMPKIYLGLIEWAFKRMAPHYKDYLHQGFMDYFTLSELYQHGTGSSFFAGLRATPFMFPLRVRRQPKYTFNRFNEIYQPLLKQVREIKRKRWRNNANYRYAIKDTLPGVTTERISKYVTMKASEIVLDYMQWKYRLPFGRDALKKHILSQKDPMKLAEKFLADYLRKNRKRAADALLSSKPQG